MEVFVLDKNVTPCPCGPPQWNLRTLKSFWMKPLLFRPTRLSACPFLGGLRRLLAHVGEDLVGRVVGDKGEGGGLMPGGGLFEGRG